MIRHHIEFKISIACHRVPGPTKTFRLIKPVEPSIDLTATWLNRIHCLTLADFVLIRRTKMHLLATLLEAGKLSRSFAKRMLGANVLRDSSENASRIWRH